MTVRQQILGRLFTVLEPLKNGPAGVREIVRRRGIGVAKLVPSIHLIVGEEVRTSEDNVGYELEFPIFFKLNVSGKDEGECCDAADTLEGALQAAIESDRQLGGLCNQILFVGGIEFANEATGGDGGRVSHYTVQYRRQRGVAEKSY